MHEDGRWKLSNLTCPSYSSLKAQGALMSWQYLFIIEGAIPILLGLITPFWLADSVGTAWYLKPELRAFATRRMVVDSVANAGHSHQVNRRDFIEAAKDWRIWSIMISNTLASLSSQGFTIFFPVVVKVHPLWAPYPLACAVDDLLTQSTY